MSGYLSNLVERTVGPVPLVQPRLPISFEPAMALPDRATTEFLREDFHEDEQPQTNGRARASDTDGQPSETAVPPTPAGTEGDRNLDGDAATSQKTRRPKTHQDLAFHKASGVAMEPPSAVGASAEALPDPKEQGRNLRPAARAEAASQRGAETGWSVDLHARSGRPALIPPTSPARATGRDTRRAGQAGEERPAVKVTIGRVEVRANFSPPPAPVRRTAVPNPKLSLDDYLKARNGGKR